jgi:hypothetical protein
MNVRKSSRVGKPVDREAQKPSKGLATLVNNVSPKGQQKKRRRVADAATPVDHPAKPLSKRSGSPSRTPLPSKRPKKAEKSATTTAPTVDSTEDLSVRDNVAFPECLEVLLLSFLI